MLMTNFPKKNKQIKIVLNNSDFIWKAPMILVLRR